MVKGAESSSIDDGVGQSCCLARAAAKSGNMRRRCTLRPSPQQVLWMHVHLQSRANTVSWMHVHLMSRSLRIMGGSGIPLPTHAIVKRPWDGREHRTGSGSPTSPASRI